MGHGGANFTGRVTHASHICHDVRALQGLRFPGPETENQPFQQILSAFPFATTRRLWSLNFSPSRRSVRKPLTFHGLQSLHPARLILALPRLWCISLNPDNVPANFTDDAARLGSQCVRVFRMNLPSGGHYNGPLCGRRPYTPRVQPPLSLRSQPTCQLAPHIRALIKTNSLAKNWEQLELRWA